MLRGRDFTPHDDINAPPVVIVTESFAKQYFPGENPIGKRVTPSGSVNPGEPPVREIVGVVGDIHLTSLKTSAQPQLYMPHQQFAISSLSLLVRSNISANSLTASLRSAVSELDKDVPLYRARPLVDYVSSSIAQPRFNAILVALFAGLALLLAAAGIFGVMSYAVTQRTHEIGIRLALGAQRSDVLRLVLGQGMRLVAIGVVAGILAVFVMSRLLRSLLYGIGATDFHDHLRYHHSERFCNYRLLVAGAARQQRGSCDRITKRINHVPPSPGFPIRAANAGETTGLHNHRRCHPCAGDRREYRHFQLDQFGVARAVALPHSRPARRPQRDR